MDILSFLGAFSIIMIQASSTYSTGGRIDHSHHFNNAHRALVDTLAFEEAILTVLDMTRSKEDTLVVVTSDHSHVFTFGANHVSRGNSILGVDSKTSDVDNMPYTTLLYTNGPGYNRSLNVGRRNISGLNTEPLALTDGWTLRSLPQNDQMIYRLRMFVKSRQDKDYVQQSAVPRKWDTHGGEDVPVYAHGSMAHLFRGVLEQTYIPHAMAYAACMGPQKEDCERRKTAQKHKRIVECPSAQVGSTYSYHASWTAFISVIVTMVIR